MKVFFIVMGYIGFPTVCIIARAGHDVVGFEINQNTFNILKMEIFILKMNRAYLNYISWLKRMSSY